MKLKKVNNLVPKDAEVLAESEFDREGLDQQNQSTSVADMSNVVRKRPSTMRELFETGILDGVSVVYMGTAKSQGFGLRGIIKDGGILCSCSSCDWAKVITTSKFEIHANKEYKRASQYICFENGKSLLDVLQICRNAPLHSLESTWFGSILWAILLIIFGSLTTCVYLFMQLLKLTTQEASKDPMYYLLLRDSIKDEVGLKDKKSLVVTARFVFGALGCVMLGALIYTCLTDGSPFRMELLYPWMVVLLVNFYINVAVLSVWVVYKESSWIIGILWVALLLGLFLV